MSKRILAAMAVGSAFSLVACGSDSSGGGSSVPLADIPGKLAQVVCDVYSQCLGAEFSVFLNGEDCVKLQTDTINQSDFSLIQAEVDAKTVSYHGDKVEACIAAVKAGGCDGLSNGLPDACNDVFQGTVADGGDCTLNEECTGESVCVIDQSCPGKCQAKSGAGSKCDSNEDCQNGLDCNDTGYTCQKVAKVGETCGGADDTSCALGLFCAGADNGATPPLPGTCKTMADVFSAKDGDACQFRGDLCEGALACELTDATTLTGKCVKPVASGAACVAAAPDECPSGEYCNIPTAAPPFAGTCTTLPGAGADCAKVLGGTACKAYTRCDANTMKCVDLQKDGGSCSDDTICYSGHCEKAAGASTGTCEASECGG